jgi:hypothetical protein
VIQDVANLDSFGFCRIRNFTFGSGFVVLPWNFLAARVQSRIRIKTVDPQHCRSMRDVYAVHEETGIYTMNIMSFRARMVYTGTVHIPYNFAILFSANPDPAKVASLRGQIYDTAVSSFLTVAIIPYQIKNVKPSSTLFTVFKAPVIPMITMNSLYVSSVTDVHNLSSTI